MLGNSLAVQWLRVRTSTAEGMGLIPGWVTKIPHAAWHGHKKKKKCSFVKNVCFDNGSYTVLLFYSFFQSKFEGTNILNIYYLAQRKTPLT